MTPVVDRRLEVVGLAEVGVIAAPVGYSQAEVRVSVFRVEPDGLLVGGDGFQQTGVIAPQEKAVAVGAPCVSCAVAGTGFQLF